MDGLVGPRPVAVGFQYMLVPAFLLRPTNVYNVHERTRQGR
jgi:hypothetical protein